MWTRQRRVEGVSIRSPSCLSSCPCLAERYRITGGFSGSGWIHTYNDRPKTGLVDADGRGVRREVVRKTLRSRSRRADGGRTKLRGMNGNQNGNLCNAPHMVGTHLRARKSKKTACCRSANFQGSCKFLCCSLSPSVPAASVLPPLTAPRAWYRLSGYLVVGGLSMHTIGKAHIRPKHINDKQTCTHTTACLLTCLHQTKG